MKTLYTLIALLIIVTSCTKVIDIDLNNSDPKIVIVSEYNGNTNEVHAKVTMTSNYFGSDASPVVDNAVITISDGQGNVGNLIPQFNGEYSLSNYTANVGKTYTLNVSVNGALYTSNCVLYDSIQLDPITYELFPGIFGNEPGYAIFANFQDPANDENNYQMVVAKDGVVYDELSAMILQDDLLTNGNYVERPLFTQELFDIGDTVSLELRSIDRKIFEYIDQASSIEGGSNSAAPANPTSVWTNGALGYFSAYKSSKQTVVIQ